jgi:ammonium transporter, Amt family
MNFPARVKLLLFFGLLLSAVLLVQPVLAQVPAAVEPGKAAVPFTQELKDQLGGLKVSLDSIWTLVAAFLVMFMGLGFAMLETGLCRAKNTVNILSKNFIVFALTSLSFLFLGWGFMFGDGNPLFGTSGFWMLSGADNSPATGDAYKGVYSAIAWTGVPLEVKFLFQVVFTATAATIISGAVAERIKFSASFLGWLLIKNTLGMRVSAEEELAGLDIGEHGIMAYPEFHPTSEGMPGQRSS